MFAENDLMRYTDRLKKFAYRLTRDPADGEDLLQETLLRALQKKHLFRDGSNLYGWLGKMMYRLFVSQYHRRTKFMTQYDPQTYIDQQAVSGEEETKIEMQEVARAMSHLPQNQQKMLRLVCVQGLSYQEAADSLRVPVGTIRSRLSRAREHLQKLLGA